MRGVLFGLLVALVLFMLTGGRLVFLPLFFALPLGGMVAGRRRR